MKAILLVVVLLVSAVGPKPVLPMFCAGALMAQQAAAQEQRLPAEHWCQRTASTNQKAHACACHQHDCTKDPENQMNHSSHTDPNCKSFCDVDRCRCDKQDCP